MRKPVLAAAALVAAVAASVIWLQAGGEPGGGEARAQSDGRPPTPVEVARVETDTVVEEASAVGTLLSNESIIVRPEIAGRIVEIHFQEGEPVEAGQPLFSLEDSVLRAELADTRARLELARRNFERAKELFERGAGTARGRDEAEAEFDRARAAVRLAEARLEKTDIVAPFAGIAGLRQVSVGDYVSAGDDLMNLVDIEPIKVEFSIPERYLSALETGQTARITADAFPTRAFEGRVYAIDPQIDPAGRSIHIRARVPNEDRVLRPGLFVRVKLQLARRENALVVPEQAIVPRGQDRYVFKVENGKAVLTEVTIGQRRYGRVEIVEGLTAGDTVVTAGQLKIRDGAPVQPIGGAADAGDGAQGS